MGSGACTNQMDNCVDLSTSSLEKLDGLGVVEPRKKEEGQAMLVVASETNSLGPITPDSDRENGDFPVDLNSPPTSVKKMTSVSVARFESETDRNGENPLCCDGNGSPQTPKDGVFDPFAPGPDDLVLAPQCRKFVSKSRSVVARRLSFESSIDVLEEKSRGNDSCFISDEVIIETMYENLLGTILSTQTEVVLAGTSSVEWDSNDCRTPPTAPRLNEIADTCPGAPMRAAGKSRKIDLALCKRLEFSP
ncbi:hypothetical protein PanWU01x14_242130 [Parasponia andersonii]|uniref:Uncharacterized protein n=1 Tax=Parasponia andersonii TaxID=3476 RepID=A0A2P5BG46_PARAD|nr:hypothetical protein PanWU01x14_242130 [Parasponia andersonii]